ncbi:polyketide synthase PksJ [Terrimicrobium sacchariphilum]|jgi:SAM-dependent methyltransferase|uniref:Polyketide synthase PksJ n=1 Tax=Terrimicrobium sacchariphilum TaxID=690879 RepID=A0A146G8N4_TERSA|nr:class I SAM-dependent methyltransferase [Terrimicrobium sacchariphilum]GAT33254.1 polyketide synthase PksJ [Terrimicrobium sacchariphilum]
MESLWPEELEQGLIPTDDNMGIMTRELGPAAREFVALSKSATRPLLDIGAAYGNATLPALKNGATVVAVDLSPTELAILQQSAGAEEQKRLVVMPARFPEELSLLDASVAGVLGGQVLHFLDGPRLEEALGRIYRWLIPGGQLFAITITPSLSYYRKYWDEFHARKARGDRWPGVLNPKEVASPEWRDRLPDMIHLFDKDILGRAVREAGFEIESLEYFCFENFPDKHRTDGREFLSLTAMKPR